MDRTGPVTVRDGHGESIPVSQRERAPLPPKVIDPTQHARLVAALGRSQYLLQQLLDKAAFYTPEQELQPLRGQVEAHLRLVRGLVG